MQTKQSNWNLSAQYRRLKLLNNISINWKYTLKCNETSKDGDNSDKKYNTNDIYCNSSSNNKNNSNNDK